MTAPQSRIRPVGAEAAALLAELHAEAFPPDQRWGADAIALMLALPAHFALLGVDGAEPLGFVMGRAVAGEAEVLTLAVHPAARRRGLGGALMAGLLARSQQLGAQAVFLEVAATNAAARGLYGRLGAQEAGLRRRYYPDGADAIVLRLPIIRGEEPAG